MKRKKLMMVTSKRIKKTRHKSIRTILDSMTSIFKAKNNTMINSTEKSKTSSKIQNLGKRGKFKRVCCNRRKRNSYHTCSRQLI